MKPAHIRLVGNCLEAKLRAKGKTEMFINSALKRFIKACKRSMI